MASYGGAPVPHMRKHASGLTSGNARPARRFFTVFIEAFGGTYLLQVAASSPRTALRALPFASGFAGFTIAARHATSIAEALAVSEITRVNGLTGVFCASALVRNSLVLAHLVVSRQAGAA
jgi:hypothetical protein